MTIFKKNLIFLIPLSFFTLQFLIRVIPGIFSEDMMKHFSMSASEFGIFSSIYYLGYAGMQIPIGILLDRYGTRNIISSLILLCAIASVGFAFTNEKSIANFLRFVTGIASVAGYIGCVKVAKELYDQDLYNKILSVTFSIGFTGAAICFLISGNSISGNDSWRDILIIISIVLTIISIISFCSLKQNNSNLTNQNFKENIKIIFKDKSLLLTSIAGGLMVGVFEGFADIWGKNFLKLSYHLTDFQAINVAALIYFGIGIGAPMMNFIADKVRNYSLVTVITGILISIFFSIVLFGKMNFFTLYFICFMIGILSGNQVLIFSMNTVRIQDQVVALATAVTNSLVMGFGIIFHIVIGYIIDYSASKNILGNQHPYSLEDYRNALIIIPIACFIGSMIILIISLTKKLKN